jgi:tetratricopeptide (TPR) repeat protein
MKILRKTISIALAIGLASCSSSFLDVEPQQSLSTDMAIGNYSDAVVALHGVYDALQSTSSYYGRDFFVTADIAGDDLLVAPENSGRFLQQFNFTTSPTTGFVASFWNRAYNAINRANNIINKIDVVTDASQEEIDDVLGQALALRALVHFDLLRIYAKPYTWENGNSLGVPFMDKAAISSPSRDNVDFVYEKIIQDLNDAVDLMQESSDKAYISKYVAKALLARVYLYMGDWENAKDYAIEVIEDGGYELVPNSDFISGWKEEFTSESIFSLATSNIDYSATDAIGYIYLRDGYGDLRPTDDILNLLAEVGGVREEAFVSYDIIAEDFFVAKFPGRGTPPQAGLDNIPVVRLAEMYLIAAEALANLEEDGLAQDYLNEIVLRADPSADEIELEGDELKQRIYLEKRVEFAFEGHRLFDISRRQENLVRGDDCTADVCFLEAKDYRFVFPIPQRELDANDNMEQNQGYSGS